MKSFIFIISTLMTLSSFAAEDCNKDDQIYEISKILIEDGSQSPKLEKFSKNCIEETQGLIFTLEKIKLMSSLYGLVDSKTKCQTIEEK